MSRPTLADDFVVPSNLVRLAHFLVLGLALLLLLLHPSVAVAQWAAGWQDVIWEDDPECTFVVHGQLSTGDTITIPRITLWRIVEPWNDCEPEDVVPAANEPFWETPLLKVDTWTIGGRDVFAILWPDAATDYSLARPFEAKWGKYAFRGGAIDHHVHDATCVRPEDPRVTTAFNLIQAIIWIDDNNDGIGAGDKWKELEALIDELRGDDELTDGLEGAYEDLIDEHGTTWSQFWYWWEFGT